MRANFGNFVSSFATFFGNFVQQKSGAKKRVQIDFALFWRKGQQAMRTHYQTLTVGAERGIGVKSPSAMEKLRTCWPATERKTPKSQNRPNLQPRYIRTPSTAGDEKYPENTWKKTPKIRILYLLSFRGHLTRYFRESLFLHICFGFKF